MRTLAITSILTFLTTTSAAIAQDTSAPICNTENICSIRRELIKDNGKKEIVPYSFKYRPSKNGAPTLVFIPGGPGGTSAEFDFKDLPVDDDYGIIFTDPMFVGVNKRKNMKDFAKATNSEQVAKDIRSALKSVGANDIVIYGGSYGTVVATILASDLSNQGLKPRAVILEGTVGKSVPHKEAADEYIKQWNKAVESAGPEALVAFNKTINKLIQEKVIKPAEVASVLQNFLITGNFNKPGFPSIVESVLQMALKSPVMLEINMIEWVKKQTSKKAPADEEWFHGVVGCKELFPGSNADGDDMLYTDKFTTAPLNNSCKKYNPSEVNKTFDSKNYQINAPVIYIQGENDPATPVSQAMYHVKNQSNLNRTMILVKGASHSVLYRQLGACSESFFTALRTSSEKATAALQPCIPENRPKTNITTSDPSGVK